MDFRQFPRDGDGTLRPGAAGEVLQERDEPRGSLEENDWPFFAGGAGQEALPFAASARDEAQKEVSVCAEPGNRKCRSDGRGAGNGDDRIARGAHRSDEVESGVAYDGRAGVGHKGDVPAVCQDLQERLQTALAGMGVEAEEAGARAEVGQETTAAPG